MERAVLPDGRAGVVIVIVVVEQGSKEQRRFVLGTVDAAATEAAIRDRAAVHGLRNRSPRRAESRALMVAVVLAALTTLTALLLSAAHVFHF